MRARAEAKKCSGGADHARMAVGFSGELSQPSWAWRGGRRTGGEQARNRADFFIEGLQSESTFSMLAVVNDHGR